MGLFTSNSHESRRIEVLKGLRINEKIKIEYHQFKGGFGDATVKNNDRETQKLLVSIRWSNFKEVNADEYTNLILNYNDTELKNFLLLNIKLVDEIKGEKKQKSSNDGDVNYYISKVIEAFNSAIKSEDYELCQEIQKKLCVITDKDKLNGKHA